jgi:CubicO group peptidase (beta-lactamase class C family)
MKFLSIAFIFFLPSGIFAQTKIREIDSLMKFEALQKNFSGVILVAEKGKPVYFNSFGYRDFAKKIPLNKTDIFEMASVSKQFTSMIIMMLKEKNQLQYDDPAEKYISIPYKGITIRHLLTHTSGLPDYQEVMDKYWDKTKVAGNADAIEYLNKYAPPALFAPGTKYNYSNTGYLLLASIAEKVSGRDFIDLCRQWIFIPLKMKNTDIRSLEVKAATPNFAIGHIYVPEKKEYIRADSFPSSDYTIWLGNRKGPGRVSSTPEDLLLWDQALYTNKLISSQTRKDAFTPAILTDGTISNYGFGWTISSNPSLGKIVYHTGDNPGYRTQIRRFIDANKTIILLNNNAHEDMPVIMDAVTSFLLK